METVKRVHMFIYGDVTGVGFRSWTKYHALQFCLTGWVRNKQKGVVEAVFEGEEDKIQRMIALCRKGPEVSWVEHVDIRWEEKSGSCSAFEIRI